MLNLENELIYKFSTSLEIRKGASSINSMIESNYKLTANFKDEKIHHKLSMEFNPEGKSLNSHVIIEKSDESTNHQMVQIINGLLKLNPKSTNDDYDVDFKIDSDEYGKLEITGSLLATPKKSNINLSADYSIKTFNLPKVFSFHVGHDITNQDKNHALLKIQSSFVKLDYGLKVLYKFNEETNQLSNFEIFVNTIETGEDKPYNVYYENTKKIDKDSISHQVRAGLKNFNLDLTGSSSNDLVHHLMGSNNENPILNSLDIKMTKDSSRDENKFDFSIEKNNENVARLQGNINGDLFSMNQIDNELEANLNMAYLKNTHKMKTRIRRDSNSGYSVNYKFETDNVFLSKYLTNLNVDLKTSIHNDINDLEINLDYSRYADESTKKTAKLVVNTDCFTGLCYIYNITYDTDSEILGKFLIFLKYF